MDMNGRVAPGQAGPRSYKNLREQVMPANPHSLSLQSKLVGILPRRHVEQICTPGRFSNH